MKSLIELLEGVKDKDSFITFSQALLKDRRNEVEKEKISPNSSYGPGQNGWENGTIEAFLDAALAGSTDNKRWMSEAEKGPTWKLFAEFLYLGKIYE